MDHYKSALNDRKGMKISLLINGKEHKIEGHEPSESSGLMNDHESEDKNMGRESLGLAPATKEAGSKEMYEDKMYKSGDDDMDVKAPEAPDSEHEAMEAHMMDDQDPSMIQKEFESKKPRSLGEHLKKGLAEKKMQK